MSALPEGVDLVLSTQLRLSDETAQRLRSSLEERLPGRRVFVLGDGLKLAPLNNIEALSRIEQKLDTLIAALAGDDDEEEQPVRSLDDGRTFPARNDRKGLG